MKNIYQALLNSQKEFPVIEKDGTNPHYKKPYATLPNVLKSVLPVLQKHGILFTSHEITIDNQQYIKLQLIHAESSEKIESHVKLINATDMQKLGSAYTYAIRYGILSLLGIAPDMDDDGNAASDPPKAQTNQVTMKQVKELYNLKKNSLLPEFISWMDEFIAGKKNANINEVFNKLKGL